MSQDDHTEDLGQQWEEFFSEDSDFQNERCLKQTPTFVKSLLAYNLIGNAREILECGCGDGEVSIELALRGLGVTALDYSKIMCQQMKSLMDLLGKKKQGLKCHPIRADMTVLPFQDRCYDLTFSVGAVEHWLDREERCHVVREMARVTRLGGKIIIVVPNGKHILYWFWRFIIKQNTPEEARHSAKSLADEMRQFGFSEDKVFPMGVNRNFSRYLIIKWLRLPALWGSNLIDLHICPEILSYSRFKSRMDKSALFLSVALRAKYALPWRNSSPLMLSTCGPR